MKIVKIDRRFKLYDEGFHYLAAFGPTVEERILFAKIRKSLREKYGVDRQYNRTGNVGYEIEYNPVWRYDLEKRNGIRSRIFVTDEAIITFALLCV